jgi:Cd(II)/Pb(II)-responsive transcriptional regulator
MGTTMSGEQLKIGELAKRTGTGVETIRYYEREGLLPAPARTNGNYRLYAPRHVERMHFIRHCRSLDMTLDEIRHLLSLQDAPEQSCAGVNQLLDGHIDEIANRIGQLQTLQKHLKDLRARCHATRTTSECEILHTLARDH